MNRKVQHDIKIGEAGEKLIISLLHKAKVKADKNEDKKKRSDFDIECGLPHGGRTFTIESKYDLYASKSGNIAIEIYNPKTGKPSGLTITKADLWCHIVDNEIYCTTVAQLKDFVDNNTPVKMVTAGGDDNATLLLFRIDDIIPQIFMRLDNLGKQELLDTLAEFLGE